MSRFPLHLIAIDAIGVALFALGLWGVYGAGDQVLPFLGAPRVAWSLVAIGVVLMVAVGVATVRWVLASARTRSPGEQD